ncbi:MAG: hypothetical protein AAF702_24250 [Chloroflexota bacterium]
MHCTQLNERLEAKSASWVRCIRQGCQTQLECNAPLSLWWDNLVCFPTLHRILYSCSPNINELSSGAIDGLPGQNELRIKLG